MLSPRPSAALLVGALCVVLGACTPAPAASPTPTPLYSSDAEALAAAEQVYRDYIDAYNQVDLADPATFEPVYALSTGDNLVFLKKELTRAHAEGWDLVGDRRIDLLEVSQEATTEISVQMVVCLNVADVVISDAQGISQVPGTRPDSLPLIVVAARSTVSDSWKVEDELGRDGGTACG